MRQNMYKELSKKINYTQTNLKNEVNENLHGRAKINDYNVKTALFMP